MRGCADSMRYAFERTWGAEVLHGGGARFRLWAPALNAVSLSAGPGGATEPMSQAKDGWFELTTDLIKTGQPYLFQLPNGMQVPDPASRAQQRDVHGPSLLVDPRTYEWRDASWQGRPWEEAIIYELHIGTFTQEGTFADVLRKLDDLVELGVTAIELMPVAQFSGNRGWGYDGVLLYAPHIVYGGPEGLKKLVDSAHARGLMVLLDVVYNHFGPDGNYLNAYAPDFFHPDHHTPWGAAIAYDRGPVRKFFIENACFWIEEYRLDGLRLDAIDQIRDDSEPSILQEIALEVRKRTRDRDIHLTTETSSVCSNGAETSRDSTMASGMMISIMPPMSSRPANPTATIRITQTIRPARWLAPWRRATSTRASRRRFVTVQIVASRALR
jgi:maltooligosyltrehalose trehalohydrolase